MADCVHLTAEMARQCVTCNPYPYTHHGPAVHGSKLADYSVSEANMRETHPELFNTHKAEPKRADT